MPRRHAALALGAVASAVVVLSVVGVLPRWAGLVHAVALPPLDLGFDLRVLVARAPSWPVFAAGTLASIAVRGTLLAIVARSMSGAKGRLHVGSACGLYAITALPLAVGAGLEFAGLASVYAWYAYAGLAMVIVSAFAFAPVFVTWLVERGSPWRLIVHASRGRLAPGVLLYLPGLLILGRVAAISDVVAMLMVVPSAVLTYWRLRAMSRRLARPPRPRRVAAVSAAVAAAILAVAVALWPSDDEARTSARREAALVLVPGIDTASGTGALYRLDPASIGFGCERVFYFSYVGVGIGADRGDAACPLRLHARYEREDTQRPLDDLAEAFTRQLRAVADVTGDAPIIVVTHSQGAWIAWRALSEGDALGVKHLIMLAPSTRTPVAYSPPGRDGEGRVGADVLRALSALSRGLGTSTFDPDAPLARDLLADPNALEELFARSLPDGVGHAVLIAAFDLPIVAEPILLPGTVTPITATHTGITEDEDALALIRAILDVRSWPTLSIAAGLVGPTAPAFMPPPSGA